MAEEYDRNQLMDRVVNRMCESISAQGIDVTPVVTDRGKALDVAGVVMYMENLVDHMEVTDASEWPKLIDRWMDFAVESSQEGDLSELTADTLAPLVRTRVLAANDTALQNYARPITHDLVQVLCLDRPKAVITLPDSTLPTLSMSVDELYECGQANTDAEGIDDVHEFRGVTVCEGESMFISSKIANMPALLEQIGVEAPEGLLFAVPDRSLFLCKVPTRETGYDAIKDVVELTQLSLRYSDTSMRGGILSDKVYYWSPDGSIEPMVGDFDEEMRAASDANEPTDHLSRESTVVLTPTEEFVQRFVADGGSAANGKQASDSQSGGTRGGLAGRFSRVLGLAVGRRQRGKRGQQ